MRSDLDRAVDNVIVLDKSPDETNDDDWRGGNRVGCTDRACRAGVNGGRHEAKNTENTTDWGANIVNHNRINHNNKQRMGVFDGYSPSRAETVRSFLTNQRSCRLALDPVLRSVYNPARRSNVGIRPISMLGIWTSRPSVPNDALVCPATRSRCTKGTLTARGLKRKLPLNAF
jgi:hypothetical protein